MGYTREFDSALMLDMLINEPLSRKEQEELINANNRKVFLDGIDKGTELERKVRNENSKKIEQKHRKELSTIIDDINDKISQHIQDNKYKK
jgi:hypothetical protein